MSKTKELTRLELTVPKNTHKVIIELDRPKFTLFGVSYEFTLSKRKILIRNITTVLKMLRYKPFFYLRHPVWSLTSGRKMAQNIEETIIPQRDKRKRKAK